MSPPAASADFALDDPRVQTILAIVARESKLDPQLLRMDASVEDLGMTSLDLTLIVFDVEKYFDIDMSTLLDAPPDERLTLGSLVSHALRIIDGTASSVSGARTVAGHPADAGGA